MIAAKEIAPAYNQPHLIVAHRLPGTGICLNHINTNFEMETDSITGRYMF